MKTQLLLLITVSALSFSACVKEDEKVKLPDPGETVTLTVNMGANYENQIWFDLGTESQIKSIQRTDWDIAFDSDAGEDHIYLNASRMMLAAKSTSSFEATTSATGLTFKPDHNEGSTDSLGFTGWAVGDVYVLDMGFDFAGNNLGFRKIELTALEGGVLSFRYAKLDGTDGHSGQIAKDADYNVVGYSFTSHTSIAHEPPRNQWDLVFTQYSYQFYDPYTPYLVTGVLINGNGIEVALDTVKNFADITRDDINGYTFSTKADAIGYEWKVYDFDLSSYVIRPEMNYIIKDLEGIYYKLHFTEFYNQGIKGNPKFEMQRL